MAFVVVYTLIAVVYDFSFVIIINLFNHDTTFLATKMAVAFGKVNQVRMNGHCTSNEWDMLSWLMELLRNPRNEQSFWCRQLQTAI